MIGPTKMDPQEIPIYQGPLHGETITLWPFPAQIRFLNYWNDEDSLSYAVYTLFTPASYTAYTFDGFTRSVL